MVFPFSSRPWRLLLPSSLAVAALAPASWGQFVLEDHSAFGIDDAEITPDGRYAVVRENLVASASLIFDLATGQLAARHDCTMMGGPNGAQDGVAVTNDRGVVMNYCTTILDLANPGVAVASVVTGGNSRDLAITPDERILAVRGGMGANGGLFLIDLQSGIVLAQAPGEPADPNVSFDVDSVAVTNDHAAFVSLETGSGTPTTRVTIFGLSTGTAGTPTVVYETASAGADQDQPGNPHDLAITPDGRYLAVRSGQSVGFYELSGPSTRRLWHKRLVGEPGPFGNSAMDSVEVTDEWVATVSRDSNGSFGAQVDLFDLQGTQRFDRIPGDPHDLAFMPNGDQLLTRTSEGLFLYDLQNLPMGPRAPFTAAKALNSTHTSFGAGLDSLVTLEGGAVTLSRVGGVTDVDIWSVGATTLSRRGGGVMPDRPLDLELSPNGRLLGVSGASHAQVWDLEEAELLLDHDPSGSTLYTPWCDGIVMNDDSMVAFGYAGSQGGWISIIDLFSVQSNYCTAAPNSVGDGATIYATGSPSEASNDVELVGHGFPAHNVVQFVYGANQVNLPFGDGFLCVSGQAFRFPAQRSNGQGTVRRSVDNTAGPRLGGAVMAGTTWNFQALYRDPAGPGGSGFNTSDAVEIPFGA